MRSDYSALPLMIKDRVERVCDAFESAWRAGTPFPIESQLNDVEPQFRGVLLGELICIDIWGRRRRGETPDLAEYVSRFPEYSPLLKRLDVAWEGQGVSDRRSELSPDWATPPQHEALEPTVPLGKGTCRRDASPSWLGRMIGPYRIIELLGRGGMGDVFRVEHTLIQCERALKTLRSDLAADPEALRRFLIEAQAGVRDLNHPNIVALYDVGRDGDVVYFVMELLQGLDLHRLVQQQGPLAIDQAVEFVRQTACGLEFAHSKGFIHRDIKPNNLLVTPAGVVKILDLGLVRVLDEEIEPATDPARVDRPAMIADRDRMLTRFASRLTNEHDLLGTVPYMSPEQARNPRAVDPASDIYSLGCTLYFLLTGCHAFLGRTPEDILDRHLRGEYRPPQELRSDLPDGLSEILKKMMHVDAAQRYPSAARLRDALEDWGRGGRPRVSVRNVEELQKGLIALNIVGEDDWNTAILSSRRTSPSWNAATTVAVPDPQTEVIHPAIVLSHLQQLQSARGGQKYGLSEYQVRTILNENADLLRLPHHVILDQIGRGWKGEVFKARHVESNRVESLRTFSPKLLLGLPGDDDQRLLKFEEYASRLQSIRHSTLVTVRGWGRFRNRIHGDLAYLASEFVYGQSLSRFIHETRESPQAFCTVGWVLKQLALASRAIQELHGAGFLHLDLSADTLMIDRDQRLRVTDSGVSPLLRDQLQPPFTPVRKSYRAPATSSRSERETEIHSATVVAPIVGTPNILPPEMLRDPRDVSPAADWYGLGCCLFYLFAGEYPFTGQSALQLMRDHLASSPRKSAKADRIPALLWPLLDRLLAKSPSDRPASGDEVATHLESIQKSSGRELQTQLAWHSSPKPPKSRSIFRLFSWGRKS